MPDDPPHTSLTDPILLVEVLSPSDQTETWQNVWAFTTIPGLREILVLHPTKVAAELLRRQPDGNWPERPEEIGPDDELFLESIEFCCALAETYARTHLAPPVQR